MHAYLIIGQNSCPAGRRANLKSQSEKLAKKLKAKILEFPLAKIEDARRLKLFTSLKITSPTAIYIDSIDLATEEALNAFLKSLEEPQENLYYILTANSLAAVLPTITSRCQIIKITNNSQLIINNENTEKFMNLSVGGKLAYCDKIKDREEAKTFINEIIQKLHFDLLNRDGNRQKIAKNLEIAVKTLNNLKLNGNTGLQLTNLIINQV